MKQLSKTELPSDKVRRWQEAIFRNKCPKCGDRLRQQWSNQESGFCDLFCNNPLCDFEQLSNYKAH
jgi:hypothetical protein